MSFHYTALILLLFFSAVTTAISISNLISTTVLPENSTSETDPSNSTVVTTDFLDNTTNNETTLSIRYTHQLGPTTPTPLRAVPEVVLTLLVIASCALSGLGIARLADFLYDKRIAAKERSKEAKNLLKSRLVALKMKPDVPENSKVKRAASAWLVKASKNSENDDKDVEQAVNDAFEGNVQQHTEPIALDIHVTEPGESSTEPRPAVSGKQSDESVTKAQTEPHIVETLDVKVKPGGRLPPVSITVPDGRS